MSGTHHGPVGDQYHALCRNDFIWVLGSVCRRHGKPFDSQLLLQRHPPEAGGTYAMPHLLQAAAELGFRSGALPLAAISDTSALAVPALVFLGAAGVDTAAPQPAGDAKEAPAETVPGTMRPTLIVAVDGDYAVCARPGVEQPLRYSWQELAACAADVCYLFTPQAEPVRDEDGARALAEKEFGFSWFVPELLKHRPVWRDVLLASLVLQIVGLATPLFTQVVIDKVVVHQTRSTLVAVAVGLAVAIVFSAVFTWVRQYLVLHTGNRVDAVLGSRVFDQVLRLPLPYFAHRPTGTLVARLQGVETIREFVSGAAVSLLLDLPFMLILLAIMFWYSWQLSLIALGLLVLLGVLSLVVTPVLKARLNRQFMLGARNQAFVTEYLAGMETLKALQLEPQLRRRYGAYLADYLAAGFGTRQVANTYHTLAQSLEQLQGLAVLGVGALLVMRNDGFTIGMLVAFQMFAGRLSQPLLRLVGLYQEFQQASLAVRRLGDIMNVPAEPYTATPSRSGDGPGQVELEHISFRYGDDQPWIYRGLSFAFKPGKTTLITGPSGAGKSTLAKLLLGFYRPGEGRVLLDGRDVRHFAANELRSRFGLVPQETLLFSGTIYDNLQMANPMASFDDIVRACRWAEIHDTIEHLPQGYQTELGEHGIGLSGGQRQRIAIARALLKRPRILIFDEATSNLDAHTAEQLARTINQLRGKATILFVAHQVPRGLLVDDRMMVGRTPAIPDGNVLSERA